ncbi:hypothetical protein TNIN_456511 [Trichonephila inaurata madagascariensis]|uniref:Uncharacterized protein n=1 Tax=Trichonephila inaurata madagascariensis TaxID=2747483 RepID=A0A8X6I8K0_9ARAC|nr:hypothetical protein TNIN_456511 [Trichonephila inaurata madagascariensis]
MSCIHKKHEYFKFVPKCNELSFNEQFIFHFQKSQQPTKIRHRDSPALTLELLGLFRPYSTKVQILLKTQLRLGGIKSMGLRFFPPIKESDQHHWLEHVAGLNGSC